MHIEEPLRLWDGVAPGSEGWTWQERELRIPAPHTEYVFLLDVVEPTLTPVLPDPEVATGTAVVVCPGGGYAALAIDHEGFDVARWLAARGIGAFVLKYRVMKTPEGDDMGVLAQAADPAGLESILRRMDEFAPIPLFDGYVAAHAAWRSAGRPVEARLYSRGGHGFGMVTQGTPSDRWIDQFHSWITTDVEAPGAAI